MQQSHQETGLSTPLGPVEAAAWRSYVESAWAMLDILDVEMREAVGISLTWYDVLVHTEGQADGLTMGGIAERILASKSGLTRVIDRMEDAGLVKRRAVPGDRRSVRVTITPAGTELLGRARIAHHASIRRHFMDHIDPDDLARFTGALAGVCAHLKTMRPGRVRGPFPAASGGRERRSQPVPAPRHKEG